MYVQTAHSLPCQQIIHRLIRTTMGIQHIQSENVYYSVRMYYVLHMYVIGTGYMCFVAVYIYHFLVQSTIK